MAKLQTMQVGSLERALTDLEEPQRSTWAQHIASLLIPLARRSRLLTRLVLARLSLLGTLCSLPDPLCISHGTPHHSPLLTLCQDVSDLRCCPV